MSSVTNCKHQSSPLLLQAHYEIHGVLGARLYHLLSKKRGDGCVKIEDFIEAKVTFLR
jgi:hypothetical protein